ncbi:MAG: hemerythrin family protein [Proteobacteria bacterium]|nr:hemerythrin family protein [Pseudomonadota bacterium]
MPLIEWDSDRFSVKNEKMDDQHKRWIEIINSLHESLMKSSGMETLEKVFQDVLDYTAFHFYEEEKLLEEMNYPHLYDHKVIHENFKEKMEKLKDEFMSGGIILRTEIMSILKNWLEDHIIKEDKRYSIAQM